MLRLLQIQRRFASQLHFDLIVIGGGSGGLSCSKRAAELGAKVALIDAVAPSAHGATWGIGGTCANVGCIPKKLMHQAALVGKELKTAEKYGWAEQKSTEHNWKELVKNVNDRIKANNWIYRVQLNQKKIKYFNAFAEFVDNSTVQVTGVDKKQTKSILTSKNIVISTGLRPHYPDIQGAELGITSDDLFTLPEAPGKTLIVGAGYVALECAGFLAGLYQDVEILIRSEPLKGFDRDCVHFVMESLKSNGVKVKEHVEVSKIEQEEGMKKVTFTGNGGSESYDTVIWATGRSPRLSSLGLVDLKLDGKSGRVLADQEDRTSVEGVYAIGDVVEGRQELTPLAIQSGKLLADRLFSNSKQTVNFQGVATTVFTPLELSTVGLTEQEANQKLGEENIEVYHSHYTPFEYIVPQNKEKENCYVKVVCERKEPQNVLGLHFVGPNAAEVMQGYAVAFRKGITFSDLQMTVAIHPCSSEELTKLHVTKRSGGDPRTQGCCG